MLEGSTETASRRMPTARLWLFATPNFPLSAITIAIAVYLPQHFAKNLGIDLAAIGAAFALVRLIDIPIDPFLGVAMDRTRSRWGRYRTWMLAGAPLTMFATYMLFMARGGVTPTYLVIWYLALCLGTSITSLSHSAWASTLATTYNERSRIFGVFGAVGVAGMALLLGIPLLLAQFGQNAHGASVPQMGWFIIATTPLAALGATAAAGERMTPHQSTEGVAFRDYMALLTNPNMVRIALASLFFTLGQSWEGGLYMFYYTDVRRFSEGDASLLLMASLAAGLLGAPAISWLASRTSKHGSLLVIATVYGSCLLSLWLIPDTAPHWAPWFPVLISGFLYAGFLVLLRAMTADIADEIRLEQRKERSALLYAMLTLTPKISAALAIWMTFNVLARIHYRPALGEANPAHAIAGLKVAYIIGPNVCVLIGALCMIGYQLTRRRAAEIRDQLQARDRADQQDRFNLDSATPASFAQQR